MRWMIVALACASSSCGTGDETAATNRQCEQLRDHVVELRLDGVTVDAEKHRATLRRAIGDDFIEKCTADLTRDQIRCGLGATDSKTALECTRDR
jgi:hypothetical protein